MTRAKSFVAGLVLAVVSLSAQRAPAVVDVQILAFNDFHGYVEAVGGSNGRVGTIDAGGVEYLAAHIARLRAENPNTLVVSAGDNIGASPLFSSLFHDEPAIEGLRRAGLQISAVGNHEFDEGWWELLRMQRGGCHPTDGCQDNTPFDGAGFEFLSANVTLDPKAVDPQLLARSGWTRGVKSSATLFSPYTVKMVGGVKIGIIGLTLQDAPRIINDPATMLKGLTFAPEAKAANEAVRALKRQGVRAIVVLIHEGGDIEGGDYNGCVGLSGPIVSIAREMSDDVAVIVSGHSHQAYNCTVDDKLLTSAMSFGRLLTDIDLRIDRKTGKVVSKLARNVIVSRDVAPDPAETAILTHYHAFADRVGGKQVGTLAEPLERTPNEAGEHALGDVIADSMLEAARATGTRVDVAMTNPGGIRADLVRPKTGPQSGPFAVSYAEAFSVLPFGNITVVKTITGEELARTLERQFDNPTAGQRKILQVSRGFSYAYDQGRPAGQRVDRASITIDGRAVAPADMIRFATVDFIWNGGDAFKIAASPNDVVTVGDILDGFTAYLGRHSPVPPGTRDRIRRLK
jgi:5'-nucleotidase